MLIARILCALVVSGSAFADAPFLDLSFPQAIEKAKETDKLVMIDFYTTWCGPCKMLDKTTWKDEAVQKWLKEKTIPLKVDAEKLRPIADKYKVKAYPTIVFIGSDEKVVGKFVGYKSPKSFIGAAEKAISGITEMSIAEEALQKEPTNPMLRKGVAVELLNEEKYEESLEHFVWCWEHGLEYHPSFSGVRVSFMLSDLSRLASKYPPALERMKSWRDIAKKQFDSKDATIRSCLDYFALERHLGTSSKELLVIYDKLNNRGSKGKQIQGWIDHFVRDELFAQGRYEEYLAAVNVNSYITLLKIESSDQSSYPEELREMIIQGTVDDAMQPLEALVILKRDDESADLLREIIDYDSSKKTVEKLQSMAVRLGRPEYDAVIDKAITAKTHTAEAATE
ncbi:thioredoxin family protein [PVC group bacterium]|nr:thioredoxin family protein [PVC group bacterium]